jgi:hypothetical protein
MVRDVRILRGFSIYRSHLLFHEVRVELVKEVDLAWLSWITIQLRDSAGLIILY